MSVNRHGDDKRVDRLDPPAFVARLRDEAAAHGILLEEDHDPSVAAGTFRIVGNRYIGAAERARVCTSWELFDRAYIRVEAPEPWLLRLRHFVLRARSASGPAPLANYETFASHHRFVMDEEQVVISCDLALWCRIAGDGQP